MISLPIQMRVSIPLIKRVCCVFFVLVIVVTPFLSITHVHGSAASHSLGNPHGFIQTVQFAKSLYVDSHLNQFDHQSQSHHHHSLSTTILLRQNKIIPFLAIIVLTPIAGLAIYRKTLLLQITKISCPVYQIPSLFHQKVLLRN